jgi:hypothetical protein
MHRVMLRLAVALVLVAPARGDAQAARVGRLPVLEVPSAHVGTCRNDPITPDLRREGLARLVSFQAGDSMNHRLVSLGLDAKGGAVMLMAMMGTERGRRGESETVNAFFGHDGAIIRGSRSAFTTGVPASRADDRELGLLPADTLAVQRLVAALRQRCRA